MTDRSWTETQQQWKSISNQDFWGALRLVSPRFINNSFALDRCCCTWYLVSNTTIASHRFSPQ